MDNKNILLLGGGAFAIGLLFFSNSAKAADINDVKTTMHQLLQVANFRLCRVKSHHTLHGISRAFNPCYPFVFHAGLKDFTMPGPR